MELIVQPQLFSRFLSARAARLACSSPAFALTASNLSSLMTAIRSSRPHASSSVLFAEAHQR